MQNRAPHFTRNRLFLLALIFALGAVLFEFLRKPDNSENELEPANPAPLLDKIGSEPLIVLFPQPLCEVEPVVSRAEPIAQPVTF